MFLPDFVWSLHGFRSLGSGRPMVVTLTLGLETVEPEIALSNLVGASLSSSPVASKSALAMTSFHARPFSLLHRDCFV